MTGGKVTLLVLDRSEVGMRSARLVGEVRGLAGQVRRWEASGDQYLVVRMGSEGQKATSLPARDLDDLVDRAIQELFRSAVGRHAVVEARVLTEAAPQAAITHALNMACVARQIPTLGVACPAGHVGVCLSSGSGNLLAWTTRAEHLMAYTEAAAAERGATAGAEGIRALAARLEDEAAAAVLAGDAMGPCAAAGWLAMNGTTGPRVRQAITKMILSGRRAWVNVGIVSRRTAVVCASDALDLTPAMARHEPDEASGEHAMTFDPRQFATRLDS